MSTIEQIKDALKTHIAEAEAATPGPWVANGYDVRKLGGRMVAYCGPHHTPEHEYPKSCKLQDEDNAAFIAHARTMSPLVCRGYLQTIEWLEEDASYTGERYCPGNEYANGVEYGKSIIGVKAYRRLESIRLEWHNLTTK